MSKAWRALLATAAVCGLLFAGLFVFLPKPASTGLAAGTDLPHYSLPWGSDPFYPAEWKTTDGKLVNWRAIPSAKQCGECHKKEFVEWVSSIHAITGPDAIYEATILTNEFDSKSGGEIATEKIRWCDGCHEPLGILAGAGSPIADLGPNEAIEEGANCILCHTVLAAEPLAGNAGLTVALNEIRRHLDPGIIMAAPAQHARSMQAKRHNPLMGKSDFCGPCHTEIRPKTVNGEFPLHFQETFDEWRTSDYARQEVHCQDCHMHPDPAAYIAELKQGRRPPRRVSHRFVGNNYLLTDTRLPMEVLRGGKPPGQNLLISIPEWKQSLDEQNRLVLALLRAAADLKLEARPAAAGDRLELAVTVTNSGAGHDLPTGALDQRYMWLEVKVSDAAGKPLYHSGWFDAEKGEEDPEAVKYMKLMYDEDGSRNTRHILFDVKTMTYTRQPIGAGKSDEVAYEVPLPAGLPSGELTVEARLWYRLALQDILENVRKYTIPNLHAVIPPVPMAEARTTVAVSR